MLFLYRPRQTWMPFARPLSGTQQAAYNRQLQQRFDSTRRIAPPAPKAIERDLAEELKDLNDLREAGALSDAEFETAKAKVLGA